MDKSPACESIGTASPKSDGPHKKTAEELVDEMFDAVSVTQQRIFFSILFIF